MDQEVDLSKMLGLYYVQYHLLYHHLAARVAEVSRQLTDQLKPESGSVKITHDKEAVSSGKRRAAFGRAAIFVCPLAPGRRP